MDRIECRADNSIHALSLAFCLPATGLLLFQVEGTGDGIATAAASVYGLGMLAMFGFSAAYHLASRPPWKDRLRICDHAAIFLMIAGTYTPFAIFGIGGLLGWGLLALVWLMATAGILMKVLAPKRWESASVAYYLALGWVGLPAAGFLVESLTLSALSLLGAGGILYTVGVGFHVWERLRFQNALWHGCVLGAAGCHYLAVISVLSPVP
jgi:hemolysin III